MPRTVWTNSLVPLTASDVHPVLERAMLHISGKLETSVTETVPGYSEGLTCWHPPVESTKIVNLSEARLESDVLFLRFDEGANVYGGGLIHGSLKPFVLEIPLTESTWDDCVHGLCWSDRKSGLELCLWFHNNPWMEIGSRPKRNGQPFWYS